MTVILDWCSTCRHIRPNKDGWIMKCDAFSENIPNDYVLGDPRRLKECHNGIKHEHMKNEQACEG